MNRSNKSAGSAAQVVLQPEQFQAVRTMLAAYAGIYLDDGQVRVLEQAIGQRLEQLASSQEVYLSQLTSSATGELQHLAELVLNHETFFFRNRPHLRALQETLLPELHRRKAPGLPIRIWSAGCATGEEPYSIAIAAIEALGSSARPIEVIGSDLSATALRRAEQGRYRGRTLQNLTPEQLEHFFIQHGENYQIAPAIKRLVRFRQLNLLEPFPEALHRVDAIFCQNVTIYFQAEARRQLIERFYHCLPTDGLLFLGFSETLWNVFDGFHSREVSGAYIYVKAPQAVPAHSTPRQHTSKPAQPARAARPAQKQRSESSYLASAKALIQTGRIGDGMEALRHIAPDSPNVSQAVMLAARAHADRGELDLAVAEALRVLERDSLNDEAYMLLGIVYGRQRQWALAITQFERARYLQPDSPLPSYHLAEAYRSAGQHEHARREFVNVLWKLRDLPDERLLDGVAVAWLRETCSHQIERLHRKNGE